MSIITPSLRTALVALALTAGSAAAQVFDVNLVQNPSAENGAAAPTPGGLVAIPGWLAAGTPTVLSYGAHAGFPTPASPGAPARGSQFFVGGPNAATSSLAQFLDVSAGAAVIDGDDVPYTVSAYLGGNGSDDDNTKLSLVFSDGVGTSLGTVTLSGPFAGQRGGVSGMLLRSRSGLVPAGTRSISVTLTLARIGAGYNDANADAVSLVLATPPACGSTDFDGDGDEGTDADIEAFFAVIGGGTCPTGTCDGIDFDGDGDEGTDADIEAFFRVIGGGACEG